MMPLKWHRIDLRVYMYVCVFAFAWTNCMIIARPGEISYHIYYLTADYGEERFAIIRRLHARARAHRLAALASVI